MGRPRDLKPLTSIPKGSLYVPCEKKKNVMVARTLEVSLFEAGTELILERDAWSTVKRPRQGTNEHAYASPLEASYII